MDLPEVVVVAAEQDDRLVVDQVLELRLAHRVRDRLLRVDPLRDQSDDAPAAWRRGLVMA